MNQKAADAASLAEVLFVNEVPPSPQYDFMLRTYLVTSTLVWRSIYDYEAPAKLRHRTCNVVNV